jgi:peptidoglycan-associated lipoprotein
MCKTLIRDSLKEFGMNKKLLAMLGTVALLSACETASQKVVSGTAATSSSSGSTSGSTSGSASSSVDKKQSLFAQAKQTAADKLIAVGDRVLFDYDSAELDSSAKILLDAQSRFLRVNSDLNFIIEGHCDERGTREYNLALGEQRATAVRDYLVIQGIDPDRIKVISYGKEKPAVVGSNNMAWSKNRRAVTVIE